MTSLSTILHSTISLISFQYIQYIKSEDFHSKSVLLIAENCLPLTDEVTVEVVHKCLQQLYLLALHFEMLGYILRLLNRLIYLRKMDDFTGDILTLRLLTKTLVLAAAWRLRDDTENKFKGLILTAGSIVLKLCVERGTCTEDVECNLRGETAILILFVIPIYSVCKFEMPSTDEQYTYRLLILTGIKVQQIGLQNEGRYNKRPQFISMSNTSPQKRSKQPLYNEIRISVTFGPSIQYRKW